jgi:hypothetical protein
MNAKHTPAPWELGEYDDIGGYDGMTAGVRAGPAYFDGRFYGQGRCEPIAADARLRMLADAALVSAAPELLEALRLCFRYVNGGHGLYPGLHHEAFTAAKAAIAKAEAA